MRPSAHSSSSRTSIRSGRSSPARSSRARTASTSSISERSWARSSRYVGIGGITVPARSRATLRAVANGRVVGIVALCAVAAVVAIVGGTLLLSRHETTTLAGAVTKPRPGTPVIELEIPSSSPLRQAQKLLDSKHPQAAAAAAIFRRYASPEAKLGLAFADWTGPVEPRPPCRRSRPRTPTIPRWRSTSAGRTSRRAATPTPRPRGRRPPRGSPTLRTRSTRSMR